MLKSYDYLLFAVCSIDHHHFCAKDPDSKTPVYARLWLQLLYGEHRAMAIYMLFVKVSKDIALH